MKKRSAKAVSAFIFIIIMTLISTFSVIRVGKMVELYGERIRHIKYIWYVILAGLLFLWIFIDDYLVEDLIETRSSPKRNKRKRIR